MQPLRSTIADLFLVASLLEELPLADYLTREEWRIESIDRSRAASHPEFLHAVAYALAEAQGKIRAAYRLLEPGQAPRPGFAQPSVVNDETEPVFKCQPGKFYIVPPDFDPHDPEQVRAVLEKGGNA